MSNLTTKISQSINNQSIKSIWLSKILKDIEFSNGGTVELEEDRIILSGDNGRHEFFTNNDSMESCFESHLDRLTNELNK